MIEVDTNHCQIVAESLTGERALDEQTFASLSILAERLERLKRQGGDFSSVDFSPAAKKLKNQQSTVTVG